MLVLSTFISANAVAVSGKCFKSTQYAGEDWNKFLKDNGFRKKFFQQTCEGVGSSECFGEGNKMKCKDGRIVWPCKGLVQDAVNNIKRNGGEKTCKYRTNNGRKTMILRIFKENNVTKFDVTLISQMKRFEGKLNVPFGPVQTSGRKKRKNRKTNRRKLLKNTGTSC